MASAVFDTGGSHAAWAFSNGDLTAENTSGFTSQRTAIGTIPRSDGKIYFEAVFDQASGGQCGVGVQQSGSSVSGAVGTPANCYEYVSDGQKRSGNSLTSYGATFTAGDILGVAVDLDNGTIWFSKNGTWQNGATIGEIGAGTTTNAAYTFSPASTYIPAVSGGDGDGCIWTLVPDAGSLTYTVPTNFEAGWTSPNSGDGALSIPLNIAATGRSTTNHGNGSIAIPVNISATGSGPNRGGSTMTIPINIAATGSVSPIHGAGSLSISIDISGDGGVSITGSIDAEIGDLGASVDGTMWVGGSITGRLGVLESSVSGSAGIVGGINAALGVLEASVSGYAGVAGSIGAALGLLESSVSGYVPVTGSISSALGVLGAYLSGKVGVGDTYRVIAMNLKTFAISEYEAFEFNSLMEWNGAYYGANDDGIFLLVGAFDGDDDIDALVRTGITDHGSSAQKRVSDVYVSGKSDSHIKFGLRLKEGGDTYDYDVPMDAEAHFDAYKAPVGRGARSKYFQYELRNTFGATFEVDSFEVEVKEVERRRRKR